MPTNDEHVSGVKISTFPSAQSIDSPDLVTGLKNNNGIVTNTNFTFSTILAWVRQRISEFYIPLSARGQANGVASLNESGKVPVGQIPSSNATPEMDGVGGAGSALTYARSDHQHPSDTSKISTSVIGAASGVASLGIDGKVPSAQLPTIPSASSATPQNLGTAAAGSSTDYSRADHVHNKPSAADINAQPTISASGILKGDGAGSVTAAVAGTDYQAPLTFDATPTASSTNPVQSGGVYTDVRTRVPNYGKGKNLLRNWYFVGGNTGHGVFPVNQRGQSSYYGVSYSVDGWYIRNTHASVELTSSGLKLKKNTVNYGDWGQYLSQEILNMLSGKTVTLSWLDDVDCKSVSFTWTSNSTPALVYSVEGLNIYAGVNSPNPYNILFQTTAIEKIFKAVKLELGTEQTLAHQENGVWVLTEIPDYEYELYRCMTSTADSSDTYANKSLATEQQLAYVETGTTASRAYTTGEYFCWNGLLYRAKTAISSGATFTVNTNCEQVTVGGLNLLSNPVLVRSKTLSTSISTGLNEWTVAVDSIPGYTAVGVVGMQFAAIPRDRVTIVQFYTDGTSVTLSCTSTVSYASGRAVSAFVLYAKN